MQNKVYVCLKPIKIDHHPATHLKLGDKIIITSSYRMSMGVMYRFRYHTDMECIRHVSQYDLNKHFKPINDVTEALYG